jgi:hypothetical protein
MVRAPARLMREATGPQGLARSPPPGGALFMFERTRDEVGSRRSAKVRGISEGIAFAQNFRFNFQTAT